MVRAAALAWAALVLAYGAGYLGTSRPAGLGLVVAMLGLVAALLGPLALIAALGRLWDAATQRSAEIEALAKRLAAVESAQEKAGRRIKGLEGASRPPAPAPAASPAPGPGPDPQPPAEIQAALPLAEPAEPSTPLTLLETIQALNFPQDAEDRAGFDVLTRALALQDMAKLLQAAEDCLNYLAHVGLYMDDLLPAPATAADWRQFAKGGAARADLMPLAGITDPAALEAVRNAMRADAIFRDTALHFQRLFDRTLSDFAPEADDAALLRLVDTRSGRAFVLLTQVSGMAHGS
ncbi:MAG: hypothetical protein AAGE76_09595 [Pseudomonadota bacterium]